MCPEAVDQTSGRLVEELNCVDCGTWLLVAAQVRDDFTEETTLAAVPELLREHGHPVEVTVDRDQRFVGAAHNEERPNQALSCGKRPPRAAFPDLPARPSVPAEVDPTPGCA